MDIPLALYAIFGFLVLSNVGSIMALLNAYIKRHIQLALINNNLEIIKADLKDIKLFQEKATRDIHEAHSKIREMEAVSKVRQDHNN